MKAGLRKLMFRDRQGGSFSGTPTAEFSGQRKSQGLRRRYQDWTHNIVLRYLARRIFVLRYENIVLRYYAGYYWYQINISVRYQSRYQLLITLKQNAGVGSRRDRKATFTLISDDKMWETELLPPPPPPGQINNMVLLWWGGLSVKSPAAQTSVGTGGISRQT